MKVAVLIKVLSCAAVVLRHVSDNRMDGVIGKGPQGSSRVTLNNLTSMLSAYMYSPYILANLVVFLGCLKHCSTHLEDRKLGSWPAFSVL
jgi:hypothetical protein